MAADLFTTHSPPDVREEDHLIAICTVTEDLCTKDALAYHHADFLAYKHILSQNLPREQQVWLSACDPRGLGTLRHGTKDVVGAFDKNTISVYTNPDILFAKFLASVLKSCQRIRLDKSGGVHSNLHILVCGPWSPELGILRDIPTSESESTSGYLPVSELKKSIGVNVQTTIVSPSLYHGGWVVQIMKPPCQDTIRFLFQDEHVNRRVARNLAPLFASEALQTFTNTSSPLCKIPSRAVREQPFLTLSRRLSTKEAKSVDVLTGAVHESAFSFVSYAPRSHVFNFAPSLDSWEELVGNREGPSLETLHRRWVTLPDHNEEPVSHRIHPFYAFGNTPDSQLLHLKILACTLEPVVDQETARFLSDAFYAAFQLQRSNIHEPGREWIFLTIIHVAVYCQAARMFAHHLLLVEGIVASATNVLEENEAFQLIRNRDLHRGRSLQDKFRKLFPPMAESPRFGNERDSKGIKYNTTPFNFAHPIEIILMSLLEDAGEEGLQSTSYIETKTRAFEQTSNMLKDQIIDELLASPWVAAAGYGFLQTVGATPHPTKLSRGLLTGTASGCGAPPGEIVPVIPKSAKEMATEDTWRHHRTGRFSERRDTFSANKTTSHPSLRGLWPPQQPRSQASTNWRPNSTRYSVQDRQASYPRPSISPRSTKSPVPLDHKSRDHDAKDRQQSPTGSDKTSSSTSDSRGVSSASIQDIRPSSGRRSLSPEVSSETPSPVPSSIGEKESEEEEEGGGKEPPKYFTDKWFARQQAILNGTLPQDSVPDRRIGYAKSKRGQWITHFYEKGEKVGARTDAQQSTGNEADGKDDDDDDLIVFS